MNTSPTPDALTIERHGDLTVIAGSSTIEAMDPEVEHQVSQVILNCLRGQDSPLLLFDLSEVKFFGSNFLAVLLKSWKQANAVGGSMALCGVSDHARELLRVTSLDMLFPMYPTRREGMEALLAD